MLLFLSYTLIAVGFLYFQFCFLFVLLVCVSSHLVDGCAYVTRKYSELTFLKQSSLSAYLSASCLVHRVEEFALCVGL